MTTRFALLASSALLAAPVAAQDLIQPIGEGPFSWDAYETFADEYQFDGETLVVLGASTGADKDKLDNLFAYFEEATGATVQLSGSESFEQDIVIAAQSETLPDIAMFPQPGLAGDMARRGVVQPLDAANRQWFEENFAAGSSWADLGRGALLLPVGVLLLRRLPVLLALARPLGLRLPDALFLGWFGPVGVSAIFYLSLTAEEGVADPRVWAAGSLAVAASTVVHGVTSAPGRRLYRRAAGAPTDA